MTKNIEVWDPHFHIWDVSENTATGQELEQLFAPNDNPIYTTALYERDCDAGGKDFEHTGGAWLEALSVCQVGKTGPAYIADCMAEYRWAVDDLRTSRRDYVLIPTLPLEEAGAADALAELATDPMVRGIRQIANYQPDWPRNAHLGDPLDNRDWQRGYADLQKHDMSFDLQLNPNQFGKAAAFIKDHPDIPVIVNHLGSPTMADVTQNIDQFRVGMEALAACENTSMKISMLFYTAADWDQHKAVVDAIYFVIDTFGTDRCFFATNYPVDVKFGWPADKLFPMCRRLVADRYDLDAVQKLFSLNARRAYRVN